MQVFYFPSLWKEFLGTNKLFHGFNSKFLYIRDGRMTAWSLSVSTVAILLLMDIIQFWYLHYALVRVKNFLSRWSYEDTMTTICMTDSTLQATRIGAETFLNPHKRTVSKTLSISFQHFRVFIPYSLTRIWMEFLEVVSFFSAVHNNTCLFSLIFFLIEKNLMELN